MSFTEKLINALKEKGCQMGYYNSGWYSIAQIEKIAKEIEENGKGKN